MSCHKIALFGEAEKGDFCTPLVVSHLSFLADVLGHPPEGSNGLHVAIQTLIFQKDVIYVRVKKEGFSPQDYERGLHELKQNKELYLLSAVCMPGMGDCEIINQALELCQLHKALFMTSEKDFYDYMTAFNFSPS